MTTSQMRAQRGETWLVRFPFTDLTSTKVRPAVVWAVFSALLSAAAQVRAFVAGVDVLHWDGSEEGVAPGVKAH